MTSRQIARPSARLRIGRRGFLGVLTGMPLVAPAVAACGRLAIGGSELRVSDGAGLRVGPVLQNAAPTSIGVMFEALAITGIVDYGLTPAFGQSQEAQQKVAQEGFTTFHATLSHLTPATRYYYRVQVDGQVGRIYSFKTPPVRGTKVPFRFAVYSDTQQRPDVHRRIVEHGLLGDIAKNNLTPEDDLGFVLVVGDIVQSGDTYSQYKERFFDPIENLSCSVPYYTVIGNHEHNSEHYFNYLDLPTNGTPGFEKHWYSFDYGNAHFIGLDTNPDYNVPEQLAWLESDLAAATADSAIDMIFVYFHHPWKSELWPDGELAYSGEIVARVEKALSSCGKPGAYFFGHTHGYSRGQSQNAPLYWVNVGSAGGSLDRWGDYPNQRPYDEYQRSYDDYGAVLFSINDGGKAGFSATRLSFGYDDAPKDGVAADVFATACSAPAPTAPAVTLTSVSANVLTASGSAYAGSVAHLESQWQVMQDGKVVGAAWRRREKIYHNQDLMAGSLLTTATLTLAGITSSSLTVQVRYRSEHLIWSDWSPAATVDRRSALVSL